MALQTRETSAPFTAKAVLGKGFPDNLRTWQGVERSIGASLTVGHIGNMRRINHAPRGRYRKRQLADTFSAVTVRHAFYRVYSNLRILQEHVTSPSI